ncbi:helix-turn-helix domain-containing protein [Atlantibacter hermannii]|uniref:helix-turn-helix domain-containing protein n=1 Tax=Atlantibacter hermannii TaxID=565 RepID=UPI00324C0B2E
MTKKTTRPIIIDAATIAAIEAQQAAGATRQQAADALGISLSSVAQHWKKRGVDVESTRQAVIKRLIAGESVDAIAAALDVSAATVRRYRREATGPRPYNRKS